MPLVSVIIPTYNRSSMLREAVESVLQQSFQDFELIVADDGSTDGTAELLGSYGDRLRAIHTPRRQGVSAARNRGAKEANGKWLAFLDSDDVWQPNKLEIQMSAHEQNKGFRFSHTDEIWVRRGKRVNPMNKHEKRGGGIFEWCLPMCRISPSSAMIDSDLFISLGGFERTYRVCEDYEFWLRLTAKEPVLYVDKQLLVKRGGHEDQLSASHWGFDRWRVRAIRKVLMTGMLDSSQRLAALEELRRKAMILEIGYTKRGKRLQALRYTRLLEWTDSELADLSNGMIGEREAKSLG